MNPPDLPPVRPKAGLSRSAKIGLIYGVLVLVGLILAFAMGRSNVITHTEVIEVPIILGKRAPTTPKPEATPANASDRDATLPPRWVPSYPAAQTQDGGTKKETAEKISGTYLAKTRDNPDKVKEYFESTLKADGFETEVKSTSTDGNDSTIVTASVNGGSRKLVVTATREKGVTNLVITYEGAK